MERSLPLSPLLLSLNGMSRLRATAGQLKGHLTDFIRELGSRLQSGFENVFRAVLEICVLYEEILHLAAECHRQRSGFAPTQSAERHRSKPEAADFRGVVQGILTDISCVLAEHTKHGIPVEWNRNPEPRSQVIVGEFFPPEQRYPPIGNRRHVQQTFENASNDLTAILEQIFPDLLE
ncbi:MAG: hypothetical protein ABL986_22280 [Vicinamibacterales bacterium]